MPLIGVIVDGDRAGGDAKVTQLFGVGIELSDEGADVGEEA